MKFRGSHLLSLDDLDRDDVDRVCRVAGRMEPFARRERVTRALEGAVLVSLFLEPSTRTRVSFGTAFNRLGGAVRETVGAAQSSISKGESLRDTGRVLSGYGDAIVVRHPRVGSVAELASASTVPVINAGDGPGEHPTQALLDAYTIARELGGIDRLDGLRVAMVGDLRHGRTVHSLSKLLALFEGVRFTFVADDALQIPPSLVERIEARGHEVRRTDDLRAGLADAEVVYATRVQEERFASKAEAQAHRGRFVIDRAVLESACRPDSVLMHPLPRDSRDGVAALATDLDDLPAMAAFRQSDNGIQVRMALFALILDVVDRVEDTARPVGWSVGLRG